MIGGKDCAFDPGPPSAGSAPWPIDPGPAPAWDGAPGGASGRAPPKRPPIILYPRTGVSAPHRTLFPGSAFRGQATLTLIPLAVMRNGSPGATPGGTVTSHVFVCSSLAVVADTPEDAEEVL